MEGAGAKFNKSNPAVKRILQECKELSNDQSRDIHSEPLEDNIFEWHFAIRGPPETDFEVRSAFPVLRAGQIQGSACILLGYRTCHAH